MKFKKSLCFLLTTVFVLLASSCNIGQQKYVPPTEAANRDNFLMDIFDKNHNLITTVETIGLYIYPIDGGFIYYKFSADNSTDFEYYRYDIKNNRNTKIGTIKDFRWEAGYDTVLYNNHLYLLIATGDLPNTHNAIYDIDLANNSLTKFADIGIGDYFNSMAVFQDKIYVSFIEDDPDKLGIYEFDINTKEKTVHLSDYNLKTNEGNIVYHISAYKDNFYVLRHNAKSWSDITVYVDIYSKEMEPISSIDITSAIEENMDPEQLKATEKEHRQPVPYFYFKNGYVYYENRSTTRALFKLSEKGTEQFIGEGNPIYDKECPRVFGFPNIDNDSPYIIPFRYAKNSIYVLNTESGQLNEYEFYGEKKEQFIIQAGINSKEDMIILLRGDDVGATRRFSMYCLNLEDLKKK